MDAVRRDIISRLERDILPLEGLKCLTTDSNITLCFPPFENAFPKAKFPIGCTHEFLCASVEDLASTSGFISVLCRNARNEMPLRQIKAPSQLRSYYQK